MVQFGVYSLVMKNKTFELKGEQAILSQLYREYRLVCSQHKVALRPVMLQLIDSKTHWGQWDPLTRTISLARRLIQQHSWFYVQAILRHEMAHQMVHDFYGIDSENSAPHGKWFQLACERLGVIAEFRRAEIQLQEAPLDWRTSINGSPPLKTA